jgi:hypothetical protein
LRNSCPPTYTATVPGHNDRRVQLAVAVEIAHAQAERGPGGIEIEFIRGRGPEPPLAVTQQHLDIVETFHVKQADHDVHAAVGVEVAHRHRQRRPSREASRGCPEGAIAVAEHDAEPAARTVGRHQVEITVVVEVADRHRPRAGVGGKVVRRAEATQAVAE